MTASFEISQTLSSLGISPVVGGGGDWREGGGQSWLYLSPGRGLNYTFAAEWGVRAADESPYSVTIFP